jgi:HEAT repeat protein
VDGNAPLVDAAASERRAAAAALGRLGTKEALKGLVDALGDGTLSVAAAALAPLMVRAKEKDADHLASGLAIELEFGRRLDGMKLMEAQLALEKLFDLA